MAEYIERETAIAWFMPYAHAGESIDADVVISDIKGMKAANVAPVRHGRWVEKDKYDFGTFYDCSICGDRILDNGHSWNYCPNCGSRMDGGAD